MQHENHMSDGRCYPFWMCLLSLTSLSVHSHDHERRWRHNDGGRRSLPTLRSIVHSLDQRLQTASKVLQFLKSWRIKQAFTSGHTHGIYEGHEVGHGQCHNNRITKCCEITLQTVLSSYNAFLLQIFFFSSPTFKAFRDVCLKPWLKQLCWFPALLSATASRVIQIFSSFSVAWCTPSIHQCCCQQVRVTKVNVELLHVSLHLMKTVSTLQLQ